MKKLIAAATLAAASQAASAAFPVGLWEYTAYAEFVGGAPARAAPYTNRFCFNEDHSWRTLNLDGLPPGDAEQGDALWMVRGNELHAHLTITYSESAGGGVELTALELRRITPRLMTGYYQAWGIADPDNESAGTVHLRYLGSNCGTGGGGTRDAGAVRSAIGVR